MNILFIHEVDWVNKVVFDIHSLAEALSLLGHKVFAIDYETTIRDGFLGLGSLRTKDFPGVSRAFPSASVHLRRPGTIKFPGLSRISAIFTHYREISRTLREKNIDAIVLYSVATNSLQTLHFARKFNVPVLFRSIDVSNQLVPHAMLRPITKIMEKRVYARSDMILTLTPKLTKYATDMGAREDSIRLLLMPVDTNIFHPDVDSTEMRRKWGIDEKDKVVIFMGTLFEFSGLDTLIPRFPEVVKQVPEAKLLIVGDGPQRHKLEEMITRLNLQNQVIITGFQPYQTMPQYINLSTICINTFRVTGATRDIFPGKIVQFLACKRAAIATWLPGMIAVISGERQGVLYTSSVDDMTLKITWLLKSPEHRHELEQAGLDYVQQVHSYEKIAGQLEEYIKEAVRDKGGKRGLR
ncbi:glycosyltransferase [Chloroflexota bacterium]